MLFFELPLDTGRLSYFQWHAHEFLFGYGGAVMAGFLLTAGVNWTGRQTLSGLALMLLLSVWLAARVGWHMGSSWLLFAGLADGLFWFILMVAIARPIIAVKQWRQLGVLAKLLLLFSAHVLFLLDAYGLFNGAAYIAIYLALFSIIGLILMMLRRIFPFFVKAASGGKVELANSGWIDKSSMILFVALLLVFFGLPQSPLMPATAAALGLVLLVRLLNWHHPFIWQAPLLWSLYLSLGFIVIGCWLLALSFWQPELRYLAIHAWSYGGFGLASLGMLVRVSIGHSGGNVRAVRPWMTLVFLLLAAGALLRILMPLLWPSHIGLFMLLNQGAWLLAFAVSFYNLVPVLIQSSNQGLGKV